MLAGQMFMNRLRHHVEKMLSNTDVYPVPFMLLFRNFKEQKE